MRVISMWIEFRFGVRERLRSEETLNPFFFSSSDSVQPPVRGGDAVHVRLRDVGTAERAAGATGVHGEGCGLPRRALGRGHARVAAPRQRPRADPAAYGKEIVFFLIA